MVFRGYPASVVYNCYASIPVYSYVDSVAETCEGFVDRVVYNFVYEMVEASRPLVSDIHPGSFSYRLETFKHMNILC